MKALSELRQAVLEARAALVIRRAEAEVKRFNPDQPRAPSGQPDGGQWINAGGRTDVAIGNRLSEDECWALYDKDTFHCRMAGLRRVVQSRPAMASTLRNKVGRASPPSAWRSAHQPLSSARPSTLADQTSSSSRKWVKT